VKPEIRAIFAEAAIVVALGLGVGLAANAISPRGLALGRNYFPTGTNQPSPPVAVSPAPSNPSDTNELSEAEQITQRLHDKNLQEIKLSQVEILFRDPRRQNGRIVFVDGRDEDHYADGHIPGAYELDPYHPGKPLETALPVCQAADQIIVYCTGGDCEDSDTAAILLRDAGVPNQKLFVFGGGFTAWTDARLPVETGERNSGTQPATK
jgi:rhodanese-related sulfurtransferase